MKQWRIDINCDLGEGFDDASLIPFIRSANIATGYHAGDEATIRNCVALCKKYDVHIGAHPSFMDRENFGRTTLEVPDEILKEQLIEQITLLKNICDEMGAKLHHVKPHGALYNLSAKDANTARIIAEAVKSVDVHLILYGLAGSVSLEVAKDMGLRTFAEGFADRRYQSNGQLVPRTSSSACYDNLEDILKQVVLLSNRFPINTIEGEKIFLDVDTICIHGDHEGSDIVAQKIYQTVVVDYFS